MTEQPLFSNKDEELVHELKEVRTVHKVIQEEISKFTEQVVRLNETEKRYAKKIEQIQPSPTHEILIGFDSKFSQTQPNPTYKHPYKCL